MFFFTAYFALLSLRIENFRFVAHWKRKQKHITYSLQHTENTQNKQEWKRLRRLEKKNKTQFEWNVRVECVCSMCGLRPVCECFCSSLQMNACQPQWMRKCLLVVAANILPKLLSICFGEWMENWIAWKISKLLLHMYYYHDDYSSALWQGVAGSWTRPEYVAV